MELFEDNDVCIFLRYKHVNMEIYIRTLLVVFKHLFLLSKYIYPKEDSFSCFCSSSVN